MKPMNNNRFKSTIKVAAALALTGFGALTTASATQPVNQVALQLGAIQLGYVTNGQAFNVPSGTTNTVLLQEMANALFQGNQALLATTSNSYTQYVSGIATNSTNTPVAQSQQFRNQLYTATLNALSNPETYTNGVSTEKVVSINLKTGKKTTNSVTIFGQNPALTTATAVTAVATARVPDLGPGFAKEAVAASMAFTTNSAGVVFPIFGAQPATASVNKATNAQAVLTLNEKTAATQITAASAVAKASLAAAVKAYLTGTKQWAKVPSTGPATNGVYLPNFSAKPIGPTGNPQPANLTGLANAASAVAANAINGLGAINTNSATNTAGLYGQTYSNVLSLSKALTQAAAAVQATSTSASVQTKYPSGAIGAETLGLITQVSGVNDSEWATAASAQIMDGIVKGAVLAVGVTSANLNAVATGICQGFYATYLETFVPSVGQLVPLNPSQFAGTANANNKNNASDIIAAFKLAGVTPTELTKLGLNSAQITTYFNNVSVAISSGNTNTGAWANTISGAKGVNLGVGTNTTPLLNGVGSPVTDTIGL